jgi:PPK2 family polyphosphate:nucleotide phosphotransferase
MRFEEYLGEARKLADPFRVTDGAGFRLKDIDPAGTGSLVEADRTRAKKTLEHGIELLAELQERLYAENRWAVLLIFQALDAAGKDSAIKHVMSGVNPQGCQVVSFKAPSAEELDHDFLWRCVRHLPERGRIGIFNRSYYEEVLVVRVHPELLDKQRLPHGRGDEKIWQTRFRDIRGFERYLRYNGIAVCKFFLHVSAEEQRRRLLARLDDPSKQWKFNPDDVREREFWDSYQAAYEDMIRETASTEAPWFAVPADNKWFTRIVIAAAVIDTIATLRPEYPKLEEDMSGTLAAARAALAAKS